MRVSTTAIEVLHDKNKNAAKIASFIGEAAINNVEMIVFPEAALMGYMFQINDDVSTEELRYHYSQAESLDGPTVMGIATLAREHEMHVIFGITERAGAVLYNTAILCLPTGQVRGFRKVHRGGSELHIFEAGTRVEPVSTTVGRLGINICYDMCFPEISRMHAIQGAEVLIFPNAWPMPPGADDDDPRLSPFVNLPPARAWENQCYVITSNQVGAAGRGGVIYYGHSSIIDPLGRVIASTGEEEGVVTCDIDVKEGILDARTGPFFGYNIMKDRRPDVYRYIDDGYPFEPTE